LCAWKRGVFVPGWRSIYSGEGASHPVRIEIPRGAYIPVFRESDAAAVQAGSAPDMDPGKEGAPPERQIVSEDGQTAAAPTSSETVITVRRSRIWLGVAVLSLLVVAATWFWSRKQQADPGQSHTVAVLPFVNLTGDAANDYLGDGMTEELIDALSRLKGLQVTSRGVAFQYKGKSMDPRELGRLLNVHDVLEGSVRQAGARIRVTAGLWTRAADSRYGRAPSTANRKTSLTCNAKSRSPSPGRCGSRSACAASRFSHPATRRISRL